MLTNFDHGMQWFNILTPPSQKSAAVYFVCRTFDNCDFTLKWTRSPVRLSAYYSTPVIHCKDRRYECDSGINTGTLSNLSSVYDIIDLPFLPKRYVRVFAVAIPSVCRRARKLIFEMHVNIDKANSRRYHVTR